MAYVEKINISNFKSHFSFQSEILSSSVVVCGNNGIGKTNLLESLSFFSNSKGMRGDKLDNFFYHKGDIKTKYLNVESWLKQKDYSTNISYELICEENSINKNFFIDKKKISNQDICELVNFIWLSPHMDRIMYEGNTVKKNFIDKIISNLDKDFKKSISNFKKLSEERIALLINNGDSKWLSIIEQKMAIVFFNILKKRRENIFLLNEISEKLLNSFKKFKIDIINNLEETLKSRDACLEKMIAIMHNNRTLDQSIKRNSFSPSIDQVSFYDCDKQLNSDMCSTGEQKSILLSVILAFAWMYKNKDVPFILLFDEISSHIDEHNIEKFFDEVVKFETQAWYTGTNKNIFQAIENKAFFIDLA